MHNSYTAVIRCFLAPERERERERVPQYTEKFSIQQHALT